MSNDRSFSDENQDASRTTNPPTPPDQANLGETAQLTPDTLTNSSFSIQPGNAGDWVGRLLGKYLITGVLGRGGMGVVLKAHDPLIERDVAIKVLSEHLATDPTALKRFLAEARAAGRLSHPNVVSVFEVGQQGDLHYLVLEFVAGGSLGEMLENSGALTALEATQATIDAARGIASAHEAGLIHRDVKPANFMRSTDGAIKVTDFGLVKSNTTQSQQVTQAGTVLGTPFYMSPEQCTGQPIDARSDIYSLGATYYSLLTGQDPFHAAAGIPQIMYAHCYGPIPDPSSVNPSVPLACSHIVARAMAKAPNDRYQTMQEMLTDLEHVRATMSGQNISALPSESGSFSPTPAMGPAMSSGSRFQRRHLLAATGATAALLLIAWWVLGRPTHMPDNIPHDQAAAPLLATDQPIKLGVLCSLSGTMADSESVLVEALLFGVDEINQSGGVLGRPLQLVVADGKSDAEMFAREAERLISAEQVHALLGCWTSDSRKAVRAVVERHDHLLIYPVQYEGLEASPSVVYLGAAPNQQILPAVHWARNSLGKNRFFLVGSDYLFPRAAHAIICDELDRLDAEVVGEHYLHLGASDVKPLIDELVAAQPDIIINSINGDSNISFLRALRAAGITSEACPTISFSIGEQGLRTLNVRDFAGDYTAWTYFQSLDTPHNRDFVARFRGKHPQLSITDPMVSGYVGLLLWARAANEAQSLEPKKIRRAMLDQRFDSPSGEVRVDSDTQHSYKTPRIGQFQSDGSLQIVWEAPAPVPPDPYPSTRTTAEWGEFLHDLYQGWNMRWSAP